jgi:hypothetical protein
MPLRNHTSHASRLMLVLLVAMAIVAGISASAPRPAKSLAEFGVRGDGATDDTAAIQAAVDAKLGSIRFPPGIYRITQPIVVNLDQVGYTSFTSDGTATLRMEGSGPAIRFVGTHAGTADPKSIKPGVWERERTPRVEGLEIAGAHPEACGIEASGTMQLTVRGTVIRHCLHGVHLVKRNRNVLIGECHIYENRGCGVYLDAVNLHQTNIVGSHISYCQGGGVLCRGGEVRNLHIGTCDIESCMGAETDATANVLVDCTGGSTAEVAIVGCTIQHNSKSPNSANIRIIGAGRGIKPDTQGQWGHVTIGDNVLSDVRVNVDLIGCRGVTMTNNTFWMGYDANLQMKDCQQVVIGPNLFERNPAYDYGDSTTTKNALRLTNCRDVTVTGLHLQGVKGDDAALVLDGCQRIHLSGCTVLDSTSPGVLLKDCSLCYVGDCLVYDGDQLVSGDQAIRIEGGKANRVVRIEAKKDKTDL